MTTYTNALEALADPRRRSILELLRKKPQSVGALARKLPVTQPAVSQHLRVLREAGLVGVEQHANRRVYSVAPDGLLALRSYIDSFWDDVFNTFVDSTPKRANRK